MNTRKRDAEAFGYYTEVAKVVPTYENARLFRPYQGGNAKANDDGVDETGAVVLTGFDIEIRLDTDEKESSTPTYTVSYSVDIPERRARPSSVSRTRRHGDDHTDKLKLDATSAVVGRADIAAREFVDTAARTEINVETASSLFSFAQAKATESSIESVDDVASAQEKAERER